MADGDCQDTRAKVQEAAGELYQIAALMMGDEAQAVELVEATVSEAKIDPCAEADASVKAARQTLVEAAVSRLSKADPSSFDVPATTQQVSGHCIDEDDLASAGISSSQLAKMMSGGERGRLRDWLNKLPVAQRTIFVERAVLGWDNAAAATLLSKAAARDWQPAQVSEMFRQALCSLATSLVHAAATQA